MELKPTNLCRERGILLDLSLAIVVLDLRAVVLEAVDH